MRSFLVVVAVLLCGCSIQSSVRSENEAVQARVDGALNARTTVQFVDSPFLPKWRGNQGALITAPGLSRSVVINVDRPLPGRFLLALVEQETGVRMSVTTDAAAKLAELKEGEFGAGLVLVGGRSTGEAIVDEVTRRAGLFWRAVSKDEISVFAVESVAYEIDGAMNTLDLKASISKTKGGESESGAAADSENTFALKTDLFKEITETVGRMLSPSGRTASSPGAGTIVVTDTPLVQAEVAAYIKSVNAVLGRSVTVSVSVYEVSFSKSQTFGLRWDTVWEDLRSQYRVNVGSGPVAAAENSSIGFGVIDDSYSYGGSKALVDALAKQGSVSVIRRSTLSIMNRRANGISVERTVGFLKEQSTTLVPNVGSQTNVVQGTISTGYSLTLVPQILAGNEVLLSGILDIKTQNGFRTITAGTTRIEAPDVSSQQTLPQLRLRSGDTAIFAGFESDSGTENKSGIGNASFFAAGGDRSGSRERRAVVMEISAWVN